jgi:hypothetical protein
MSARSSLIPASLINEAATALAAPFLNDGPSYRRTTAIVVAAVATPKGEPATAFSTPLDAIPKAAMSWLV